MPREFALATAELIQSPMLDLQTMPITPANVLADIEISELPNHYRGKVRDNYDLPDGTRLIIASDRISAFDRNLAAIPFKGQVLTQIARYWFEKTQDICPNHVIEYPDPNVLVCKRLKMLPVEMVVRDYLAGSTSTSILSMYKEGQRTMYGHNFPDGMRDNEKLPKPIITPTTKAAHGSHDEPLTAKKIVEDGLLTAEQWRELAHKALELFARGRRLAAQQGLILADTKYEFGLDEEGRIVLADEIHTPDSSRYWLTDSYKRRFARGEKPESFDKDFIRNWVVERCDPYKDAIPEIPPDIILDAAQVYIKAFEKITGLDFAPPDLKAPALERIRKNVAKYFPPEKMVS